ncbi:MAG: hypothetical protein KBC17_01650 [Candidatus Pacebacteria bacterium]|nr:hypothetical protein [Candidatus Paceibacterota bacterium]
MKLLKFFFEHDRTSLVGFVSLIIGLFGLGTMFTFFPDLTGITLLFAGFGLLGIGLLGMEDSCIATYKAYRKLKKACGIKGFKVLHFVDENRKFFFRNIRTSEN